MSLMAEAATTATLLDEKDLQSGIAIIETFDTVQRWHKRGKRADDIEMEVPNVIRVALYKAGYQKEKNRLCEKYRIDERELVRRLLHHIAR